MPTSWKRLLEVLPVFIFIVVVEISIVFSVAAFVMLELMQSLGRHYPHVVLAISVGVAVMTHAWIVMNHRVRAYIKERS